MDRVTKLKQEIFDEVFAKAAKQGFAQSSLEDKQGTCAYRGKGELRCNVGLLIPDERYHPGFEGNDIDFVGVFEATTAYDRCIERGFDDEDQAEIRIFLGEMQTAHDNSSCANEHRRRLDLVAREEGLKVALTEAA